METVADIRTRTPMRVTAHEELCIERVPQNPCGIVIFGASGDLTHRKLSESTDASFREQVSGSLVNEGESDPASLKSFLDAVYYKRCDYSDGDSIGALGKRIAELEAKHGTQGNAIYYLATPPSVYASIVRLLGKAGMIKPCGGKGPRTNVIIEKPFGHDLDSARALDAEIRQVLDERQIYRIDHYLGKETVQNIMMFRFANMIFEPIWNRRYIDHVQITAAETLGVGHRAGYYESSGAVRDMFQNHMMQLLSLVAMEPPVSFVSEEYRDEKVKLLRTLRPLPADKMDQVMVRGQYAAGQSDGAASPGYLQEKDVAPGSSTETFAAVKLFVDNWRWQGVPFYLRTGKRLAGRGTEIVVQFKHIPHSIFAAVPADQIPANTLTMRIQPDEGIAVSLEAKSPGPKFCMATLNLDVNYKDVFEQESPDAYARLLLDCMNGDQTLFVRQDMVEVSWAFLSPLLKHISERGRDGLRSYAAGTWGPDAAEDLLARDGRAWKPL